MKAMSPGRPHSTLLEVTGVAPTVLSGRNIEFMLLSERGNTNTGPVEIHPPYHYDIGADLPEEDELLDVHEMIDISIFVRTFRRWLVDEAAVLQFWTEHGGRKRACGPGKLLQNKIRSANKSFLGKMVDKKNTLESASAAPRLPNQQSPLSKLAALPKVWGEGCEESEDHEDQDCGVQGGVKRGKVSGRNVHSP
ncbi:uncharacterized protein FFE2_06131 [Fusarium fujikuroi]|nr:uncharacterized protein FFE2_06131 [Fusarium fujikuroi]SCN93140.1 uncharacterized protein FFM5_05578 [Fusarium fujikuroi]